MQYRSDGDVHRSPQPHRGPVAPPRDTEEGSLVAEYGLIAVVGATIAGLAIKWASGGAIFELLGAIMSRVKGVVGL